MSATSHLLQRLLRPIKTAMVRLQVRQLTHAIKCAEAEGDGWHPDVVELRVRRLALLKRLRYVLREPAAAARLDPDHPMHWGI